jgi:RNA polymerase sigma factor (sigma-70 family)
MDDNMYIPDDSADKSLVRDIYEVALQLAPRQREVFFLFYDQQFSMKEIVEITGLKEGNIKFILNQARGKIKQKLSRDSHSTGAKNDR